MKDDYTFFPNPTNGKVEYKGNELTINQIDIFDNVGRLVKQIKKISENSLGLNELNDGIYLVKIQTENGNLNQKIIIKK